MLSVIQQPTSQLLSAGNDNVSTLSGDTYGGPNVFEYRYVADVYVNGILSVTLKSFPDPVYGFGVFNLRNIAPSFVGTDFFPTDETPMNIYRNCPNSSARISLSFGEEYVSGTTFVQTRDVISGNTAIYINASLGFTDQESINLADYMPNVFNSPPVKYLVGKNRASDIFFLGVNPQFPAYKTQRQFLYYLNNKINGGGIGGVGISSFASIFTYDANANLIGQYQVANPFASLEISGSTDVGALAVGYPQIAALTGGDYIVISGPPTIFGNGEAYYLFSITIDPSGPSFEYPSFVILDDCGRTANTAYNISWLNEFGGFNSWLFNKKNETTQGKTVQKYKKPYGKLNADGSFSINTYDVNNQPFFTVLQDSIVMNTDLLTDNDVLYLKTLISSPMVFMQDQNGLLTAITVEDDSYRINKKVNQKIYSLQMNVKQSYNDYRQNL